MIHLEIPHDSHFLFKLKLDFFMDTLKESQRSACISYQPNNPPSPINQETLQHSNIWSYQYHLLSYFTGEYWSIITLSGLELCFTNSGRIKITWWYFEENISSLSYWSMIKRRPLQRPLESSGWWLVARGTNFVIRVWNCQPSLPPPPGREPGVSVKLQWSVI